MMARGKERGKTRGELEGGLWTLSIVHSNMSVIDIKVSVIGLDPGVVIASGKGSR